MKGSLDTSPDCGHGAAMAELCDRLRGRFLLFARARGLPDADADDVVQETLLALVTQLREPNARPVSKAGAFALGILRHKVADYWRARLRRRHVEVALDDLAPREAGRLASVADPEQVRLVEEILRTMRPRERLVLVLNLLYGRPAREIAGVVGLGTKVTEALLTSAKRHFRDLTRAAEESCGLKRLQESSDRGDSDRA